MAPVLTLPVLTFLGTIVQLGAAVMLIALFLMLRQFVLRRPYFSAWGAGWVSFAVALLALAVRSAFVPGLAGAPLDESDPATRVLYFVYQASKGFGFVYFLRGTLSYISGPSAGLIATRRLGIGAVVFALVSTLAARNGLNEMVVWQSAIAVPALGYCASALLWLPRPRRTVGSLATGVCFALLALLGLVYAGALTIVVGGLQGPLTDAANRVAEINSYLELSINVMLGYAMIRVLVEDAKREMDDAQAELRVTHDRLRRAALYDSLTESLNRRAFSEGVGLDMVRATFGTVVIADVDDLKLANDRYGHAIGDQLIRRCADVLRAGLRRYDKLYRWGGDEFLVVLPSARAADVLTRLRATITEADPIVRGTPGRVVRLSVSLGAADYSSSADLSAAIERADAAMYEEKARRKGDPRGAPLDERAPSAMRAVR